MATERLSITLPKQMAKSVREEARKTRRPVSRVIADALKERDEAHQRELMIRGYKEAAEENRRFAEEALPLALETWPED